MISKATEPNIAGMPTEQDSRWLCLHPDHSMVMVEIDGVFVPMIVDEKGNGPVIPVVEGIR